MKISWPEPRREVGRQARGVADEAKQSPVLAAPDTLPTPTPSTAQPWTRHRGESKGRPLASVPKHLPTAHSTFPESLRTQGPPASAPTPKSLLGSALPRTLMLFARGSRCLALQRWGPNPEGDQRRAAKFPAHSFSGCRP